MVARIPQYASVNVQQRGDSWCYVVYQDTLGYVMTQYLSFAASTTPTETPSTGTQTQSQIAYVKTVSGGLNLREQAGSDYRVIKVIPKNAQVTVNGYGADWCAVSYAGYTGYVMTSFLRFETVQTTVTPTPSVTPTVSPSETPTATVEGATPTPTPTATPSPTPQPTTGTSVTAWVVTASGSLNMRSAPNSSQILTTIPRHAAVTLYVENGEWSYVSYNGRFGYVMTKYLSKTDPNPSTGNTTQQTAAPQGGSGQIIENGGVWLDVTLEAPASALYALAKPVSKDAVSLWSMCKESGTPLGTLASGQQVEVVLKGDTWCLVQYETLQGYCLTAELQVMSQ